MEPYAHETELKLPLSLKLFLVIEKLMSALIFRRDGSINRGVSDFFEYLLSVRPSSPRHGISCEDILIDKDKGIGFRIYTPSTDPGEKGFPIVFYIHGGGFVFMTPRNQIYDAFCNRLCESCNAIIISIDYRRSPEFRYPTAYEDCLTTITWVHNNIKNKISPYADASSMYLVGDSAGGNIVHHVTSMILTNMPKESRNPLKLKGIGLLCPFFGGEERTPSEIRMTNSPLITLQACDSFWNAYLPLGATRDHQAAHVFGQNDIYNYMKLDFPLAMVIVAEHDILKDWQLRYVEQFRKFGKRIILEYCKGGFHSSHLFPQMEMSSYVIDRLRQFMEECCELERS